MGTVVAEASHLGVSVALGHVELFLGHIDAEDVAVGADQARGEVDIASAAAAEVKHRAALEGQGNGRAAAVEAVEDLVVDLGEYLSDVARLCLDSAAGVGLEVLAILKHFAVVFTDGVECGGGHLHALRVLVFWCYSVGV